MAFILLIAQLLIVPNALPAASGSRVYLPLLTNNRPLDTVFGIEMSQLAPTTGLNLVLTSGTGWVRRNAMLWSEIEPVEGAGYRWDVPSMQQLETEMLAASAGKLQLILVVRSSPNWAVAPYSAECGPVNSSKRVAFARFMAAAVARYSVPPYNVRYWEIGNEPDATLIADDFVYGCWGIEGDPYYGGREYGEVLKAVYPAMKQVNPRIQVLNGGLLLANPYTVTNSATVAGRFFEGMLETGAGNAFDITSFHTYTYYSTGPQPFGPPMDWRISYLKELLQRYGVPPKPLIRTEAALLCVDVTPACRWAQADLVGRVYARTLRDGLLATIWYIYDSDSYHNTAMIEPGDVFVPRPTYFAYRYVATLLGGAAFLGAIEGLPSNIEGYTFRKGGSTIYTLWTDDRGRIPTQLRVAPEYNVSCFSRDGAPIACTHKDGLVSFLVDQSPLYIVVS